MLPLAVACVPEQANAASRYQIASGSLLDKWSGTDRGGLQRQLRQPGGRRLR